MQQAGLEPASARRVLRARAPGALFRPMSALPPLTVARRRHPSRRPWWRPAARALSIGLHPFVVAPLLAVLAAAPRAGAGSAVAPSNGLAAGIGGAVALLLVASLGVLTWWQVRRGAWETVDASRPRDRPILFGVTLGALLALGLALTALAPASPVTTALPWVGALVVCCALLTRWIKLSLHQLVAALAGVVLLARVPVVGVGLLALLPALGWSRVTLERHRWSEVLVGTAVGVLAGLVLRHVA